jgi:hypothetical protein
MRVLSLEQRNSSGDLIWANSNIGNLLHGDGEKFLLNVLFTGSNIYNTFIPNYYYLGLDNRSSLSIDDTMAAIVGEPTVHAYARQPISSSGGFSVVQNGDSNYQATSPVVTFRATGGTWGPVANIFLTDKSDLSGSLIASANLGAPFQVSDGDTVTVRLGMSLRDCPVVSTSSSTTSVLTSGS